MFFERENRRECGTCTPYRGCMYATIVGDISRERDEALRRAAAAERELEKRKQPTPMRTPGTTRNSAWAWQLGVSVLLTLGMYIHVPPEGASFQDAGAGGGAMLSDAGALLDIRLPPPLEPSLIETVRCHEPDAIPTQSRAFIHRPSRNNSVAYFTFPPGND